MRELRERERVSEIHTHEDRQRERGLHINKSEKATHYKSERVRKCEMNTLGE